ncbi:GAF domain-containing protein [Streptomyces massasporeus]|uniref:GAF domain-containing protein n=1 Tax=Streptomyces massasporeus TaxID=67324 RepID=A0ABW6LE19_9ACTN
MPFTMSLPSAFSLGFGVLATSISSGGLNWPLMGLGVATVAASGTLPYFLSEPKNEIHRSAVFDATVHPVTKSLGDLMQNLSEAAPQDIATRLTEAAQQLIGASSICAFFELDEEDRRTLKRVMVAPNDRADIAPTTFTGEDDKGAFLVHLTQSPTGRAKYVGDIKKDSDRDRIWMANGHRTALFVPVHAGSRPHGLLVIQSTKPGDIPAPALKSPNPDVPYLKFYGISYLLGLSRVIQPTLNKPDPDLPNPRHNGKVSHPSES